MFEEVPGEGGWSHVLLADGNLGIGGAPQTLLSRVRALLAPDGSAIVEVCPPGTGLNHRLARIGDGPWFAWSDVGVEAVEPLAASSGFRLVWTEQRAGRWFGELARR